MGWRRETDCERTETGKLRRVSERGESESYEDDEDELRLSWSEPNEHPLTTIPRRSMKKGTPSQTQTPPENTPLAPSPTQRHVDRRTPSSNTTPFPLLPTIKNPLPPTTLPPSCSFPFHLSVHPSKHDSRRSTRHDDKERPFCSISTKTHPPPNSLLPCSSKRTAVEHSLKRQFVTTISPPTVTTRITLPNDVPEQPVNRVWPISIFPFVFPTTTPPLANDTPSNSQDESANRPSSLIDTTLPFPPNLIDDIFSSSAFISPSFETLMKACLIVSELLTSHLFSDTTPPSPTLNTLPILSLGDVTMNVRWTNERVFFCTDTIPCSFTFPS